MSNLFFLNEIKPLDKEIMRKAKERLDNLAKPIGSLGNLEQMAIKLSGITGQMYNKLEKKAVVIMCSDNGVCEEGIASAPQIVTYTQTTNFSRGITGVCVLAKHEGADVIAVDVGIKGLIDSPSIISKKIRMGTSNIAKGEAMTREEAIRAMDIGFDLVKELKDKDYKILGTGEMGIGNTTTSSAILIALTDCEVDEAVGYGAGLTLEQFNKKKEVIKRSISINKPDKNDPIDVLHKLGGFDIAALVGMYLGAAYYRVPIVIDGFISVVSALIAYRLNPLAREFMFPSHVSKENGYNIAIDEINLRPILNLDMRLGEGSGCPLAFNIIEAATAVINNMATFEEAKVDVENYKDFWRNDEDF